MSFMKGNNCLKKQPGEPRTLNVVESVQEIRQTIESLDIPHNYANYLKIHSSIGPLIFSEVIRISILELF
jgi:hypothetical protein